MKQFIIFAFFLVAFAANVQGQTSTNGQFTFAEQGAYNPLDHAQQTGTTTILGTEYPVYQTDKGKTFVHLRGKYFVYTDLQVKGTLPDGTEVYTSPSGTPFVWAMGKNGVYAKYGKAN